MLFFQLIKHWPTLHPHLHLNKYLSAIAKPINITKEHTNLFSWSYTQKAKISWPGIIWDLMQFIFTLPINISSLLHVHQPQK